ncbi:sensor domain-containing protein [Mycolicibacterium sp. GF69]|uniref:sensor domain-containing protein n=1 Tax=Mycolicibacterium sp. GF69 TaxID=2267251 RepID=UPI001F0BA664|nr:sensor domain-containing protein [Mycolicibacterium sp. GF69]
MQVRRNAVAGLVVFATASLIAGCGSARERTAESEAGPTVALTTAGGTAPTTSYAWLSSVLPDDKELTDAVGFQVRMDEPPSVGPRLRNTAAGSRELTESLCFGVVSPFEQQVYGVAPVRAVSYATESSVTFGAAAIDSAADARDMFDAFARQWRDCQGKTVLKIDGAYTYEHRITQVDATPDVVSAVDAVMSSSPTGVLVRSQRALGVAKDCIVEVTVPISESETNENPITSSAATDLVNSMLARVRTVRR